MIINYENRHVCLMKIALDQTGMNEAKRVFVASHLLEITQICDHYLDPSFDTMKNKWSVLLNVYHKSITQLENGLDVSI